jgi:signal transduction histidine kinase
MSGGKGKVTVCSRAERQRFTISIEDNGEGILPELQARIYEPFFTTKGSGTGLGLTIVKQIVAEHRGSIRVFSRPLNGTRFEVVLPIQSAMV